MKYYKNYIGVNMANCIAYCRGMDKSRTKEDHRLGSEAAESEVATYKTKVTSLITKYGEVILTIKRGNKAYFIAINNEDKELEITDISGNLKKDMEKYMVDEVIKT